VVGYHGIFLWRYGGKEEGEIGVDNAEIAQMFFNIAELLKLKKENIFKIRAYEKAAKAIVGLEEDVAKLAAEGKLREVPGVGEAINKKITELVTTGKLAYYERLKTEFPEKEGSIQVKQ
jgi:DNA polymerase (family 10)